ncbi:hypothetical protein Ssi02_53810 [Sinosporangium siamense]|uniref:VWFA domain-containing protein n=1 Tax=Sinosporangium siamense TaxID=1367973 RepID=A0A919RLR4_9ACTN|nr:hypothetical protein Ssi02_53810 [Sinosporangium siamense]
MKRQAARFRVYAHHDDGTTEEITDAEAQITWVVHLANTKAAHPDRGNNEPPADLSIDPGPRTLTGPGQEQAFDTGTITFAGAPVTTVPLGEIRSTPENHLLVLGGYGAAASPIGTALGDFWANDDWYDDVADGPVSATIRLRADDSEHRALGAWVLVGPPKFAPDQDNSITLYDRVLQAMVDGGLLPAPATTSYTGDIHPVLQRARDSGWVAPAGRAHTWPDPVTGTAQREAIFDRLKAPGGEGGNMPSLNDGDGDGRLTAVQYAHMERWKNGDYENDWTGPPSPEQDITPGGLDRAALEACVGGSFAPGIEAGGLPGSSRTIIDASKYLEPFRLNHDLLTPGALTHLMALPWQSDFWACGDQWWPVPRPNFVTRQGTPRQLFTAGLVDDWQSMVDNWHRLGFVVRQGTEIVEVDRCDTNVVSVHLLTPLLNFQAVPQGPMGMVRETALPITFEVSSPSRAVALRYTADGAPSHPRLAAANTSVTVEVTEGNSVVTARLWVVYRTGAAGAVLPPQKLTVEEVGGTGVWEITVIGDTVARRTAAAALVLDRSGSMSGQGADGQSRHAALQRAASVFADVMLEGDGVGVVGFNEDAQVLSPVVPLGAGGRSDAARNAVKDAIRGPGLDPEGETSIGDGIAEGREALGEAAEFDVKSLVVVTGGVENHPRPISEVAPGINEPTYAVGLGRPHNISVSALQAISGNNGGYLLMTGETGSRFLLQKYFLQILAGVSDAGIVLDPEGTLLPDRVERIPFRLTAADSGVDVILLTPSTRVVDFRVETPSGQLIEPWRAVSEPGMRYVQADGVSYYRLALPAELTADRYDAGGTWHAVLKIGLPRTEPNDTRDGADASVRYTALAQGGSRAPLDARDRRAGVLAAEQPPAWLAVPYGLVVHTYSNLAFDARADQAGMEPGARITLHATLTQSGVPLGQHADVWAEITAPDGGQSRVSLPEGEPGRFTEGFDTTGPGVYRIRMRARGTTLAGEVFVREKTLTGAVWRGGDREPAPVRRGRADP